MNSCLTEICHQTYQSSIPLICNLSKGSASTGHEYLSNSILKLFETLFIDFNECLSSNLLGIFILKSPSTIFLWEFLLDSPDFGKDANFKSIHIEKQIRVVLRVNWDKTIFPFNGGKWTREPILDFPENGSSQIDIVLHESHTTIARPALFVIIANDILVIRVWIFSKVPLYKVSRFLLWETENDVQFINIATVEADGMSGFGLHIFETHKLIRTLWGSSQLWGSLKSQNQNI